MAMRCPGRAIGGPIRVPASTIGKRPAPSARTAANRPTPPPSSQAPSISPTALDTSMMVPSSCITAGRSAPASPTRNSFIRPLPDLKARALYQRLPPAPARRLVHFPQAPGARSARLATRRSARRAVARSGPLCGPAHPMLTPVSRRATGLRRASCVRRALLSFSAAPEGPPARANACTSAILPIAQ